MGVIRQFGCLSYLARAGDAGRKDANELLTGVSLIMAEWHLREIRNALEARGWRIIAERPGDDYRVSATWEIERSTKGPPVFIDFEGLDDLITLPLEQSYGCHIRGHGSPGLYLGRKGEGGSRRRQNWRSDLKRFISELDRVGR